MHILKSFGFTAMIDPLGAELVSLRDKEGNEIIWTAEDVWKRHAPVLFPFVCNTPSKKYTVNGKEYAMGNHGFARDSMYTVTAYSDSSVTMTLESSDATRAQNPYDFRLDVTYTLIPHGITCTFDVHCLSDEMYFFIGGHPGFLVPFSSDKDGNFTDYDVVYEKPETIVQYIPEGNITVLDNGTTVPLTRPLFAHDVFLQDKPASSEVSLVQRSTGRKITVRYDKAGTIAVWSPYDERAHFVCLEPWAQPPVYESGTEELTEMPLATRLERDGEYRFSFEIAVD